MVVSVPKEVHESLERLKRTWSHYLKPDEINLMLLVLVNTQAVGDALTLKKFALRHPTVYLQAITNGYIVKDVDQEVVGMIKRWLNTPYVNGDLDDDINLFAEKLSYYFSQHT